jgi:hypothetical protein
MMTKAITGKALTLGLGLLGLTSCISPHGMQAVGGPDDAGYVYHEAQACPDKVCGTAVASAALYGPARADGTREVIPLGSTSVFSSGALAGLVVGAIAAGGADGFSHNPNIFK